MLKKIIALLLLFSDFAGAAAKPANIEENHSFKNKTSHNLSATSHRDFTSGFATDGVPLGLLNFETAFYSWTGGISEREIDQMIAFDVSTSPFKLFDSAIAGQNNVSSSSVNDIKTFQHASKPAITLVRVPLPAAVWSMLSGLLTFLYFGRRKNVI